jgi:hypothetical protein
MQVAAKSPNHVPHETCQISPALDWHVFVQSLPYLYEKTLKDRSPSRCFVAV